MPACFRGAIVSTEPTEACERPLTLRGGLVLGGLGAELIFDAPPHSKIPRRRGMTTQAVLVPAGEYFEFRDQRVLAGVGNPVAWIQIGDAEGNPMTDEFYIGRLGRDVRVVDPSITTLITAETLVTPIDGEPDGRFDLTLAGELTFVRGISARIVLRRRGGPLWWSRPPDQVFELEVVPPGQAIRFPEQPIWTADGGGVPKSLRFLNGEGEPVGGELPLEPQVSYH